MSGGSRLLRFDVFQTAMSTSGDGSNGRGRIFDKSTRSESESPVESWTWTVVTHPEEWLRTRVMHGHDEHGNETWELAKPSLSVAEAEMMVRAFTNRKAEQLLYIEKLEMEQFQVIELIKLATTPGRRDASVQRAHAYNSKLKHEHAVECGFQVGLQLAIADLDRLRMRSNVMAIFESLDASSSEGEIGDEPPVKKLKIDSGAGCRISEKQNA